MFEVDMQAPGTVLTDSVAENVGENIAPTGYICKLCLTKFSRKDNLKRHMLRKHRGEKYEEEYINKKTACVYSGCLKSFYHKTKLIEHIEQDHFISCQTETIVFKAMQDFLKWKEQEEQNNYIHFTKMSGTMGGKTACYSYYACQRDGETRSRKKVTDTSSEKKTRNRKSAIKIGSLCPARLQVKSLVSGGVVVKYIKTHSHPIKLEDTEHQPTPKAVKAEIINKILQGMQTTDIRQSLVEEKDENGVFPWPQRKKHLVSRRFINEMKRKLKNTAPPKEVIFQLREITGKSPEQVIDAYMASNGDMKRAVAILTGAEASDTNETSSQVYSSEELMPAKDSSEKEIIEIRDDRDDDLAKAIELSLREAQGGFGPSVSDEDREISKALEASLVDSRIGNKRKRGNLWMSFIDPENPHERKRKEGVPVGLKNIGNTCWFSAVIQSLFHLPKFRNLVLNCGLSEDIENLKDKPKLAFVAELQNIFSLLLRSKRKYVDPARPIEILEEAVRGTGKENAGDQQDVSEFTHVLLDWLEDAFQSPHNSSTNNNPIAELFYGRYSVNGCYDGKEVKNEETFGALPLHVRGHDHIYDGLDAAMVNNEIKTNNQDPSANSSQEHWFTHLPAVLTFELSRFIFNQKLSKAEKIHDPFRIEQIIHLARYMEQNKNLTREKRKLVDRSKRKRRELLNKLEKYMSFGIGPKKNPIISTLDSTLEFIRKGLNSDGYQEETPMTISPSSSPSSSTMQEPLVEASVIAAADNIDGPSPKIMAPEEGNTMIDCLQRWKEEIELETEALRKGIEYLDREIHHAYDDDVLQQVPYRLHAILAHEGHANGGHYWSYIFDYENKIWRKFNDITVSETTWDEVQRESVGGHRNTSAYCLVYVDACRTDLFELDAMEQEMPDKIKNHVENDNEIFSREIADWDAKQRKIDIATENVSFEENKENTSMAMDPKPTVSKDQSRDTSLDDQLETLYTDQYCRTVNILTQKQLFDPDPRLESIASYFCASKAPIYITSRGFLECIQNLAGNHEERFLLLQRHAQWKLKKIEQDVRQNEEYMTWKQYFKTFLKCNACFVSGAEAYYEQRYREGLPCFVHAIEVNNKLITAELKPSPMDSKLLSHFRTRCLQHVNEEASKLFESKNIIDVEEGCSLMKELVVPSLASISEAEEKDVAESVRGRWCAFVGSPDIHGQKNEMLEEIITSLVDSSAKVTVRSPSIKGPLLEADLFKRYAEIMERVKHESIAFQQ